jgi:ABC-type multidrug transport system ATPase subunit
MLLNVDITEKDMGIKPLFRGLSLHVNEGEKLAIIGRNGAGKTTLFNMLIGKPSKNTTWIQN